MRKNIVNSVIIHGMEGIDISAIADRICGFHVEIIERRLNQTNISMENKIELIDSIKKILKAREKDGLIK